MRRPKIFVPIFVVSLKVSLFLLPVQLVARVLVL
jgi:hypothetical protein